MASEKLHPGAKGHALDPKRVTLRIYPNNVGIPTFDHEGGVASVVRDGSAGRFLVTLSEAYYKVINCQATFQCAGDAVDIYAQLGDFANVYHKGVLVGTAGQPTTFKVKLKTGTVSTDVAVAAQTCIFVDVTFEDIARD
jgi:hypothetical protein